VRSDDAPRLDFAPLRRRPGGSQQLQIGIQW
jgi:hypothetical protein